MSNDRRDFLKALGVTAAAVAGTGCGVAAAESGTTGGDAVATSTADATVATDESAIGLSSRATAKYGLELDGSFAGWLQTTDGGNATADVVTEKLGPDGIAKKHLAGVKYEDITVNCGTGMSKAFFQWIQDTLSMKFERKDGAVIESDFSGRELRRMDFKHALISELDLPALDASSRAAAKMTLKFSPEFTKLNPGSNAAIKFDTNVTLKWRTSDFKLRIDGLDEATSHALKIESITIKQNIVENAVGETRDFANEPAGLDFGNVAVTVPDTRAQSFYDWSDDFIVQGNNGDDKERGGTLDYLDSRGRPLFTLTFSHLGVFKVAPVNSDAAFKYRTIKGEMYVERIQFGQSSNSSSSD